MADELVYWGAFQLDDDSEELVNLERASWNSPARLKRTKRLSLIPKDDAPPTMHGSPWPVVAVNIPVGGEVIFKTQVKASFTAGAELETRIRLYCIGYRLADVEHLIWVLPTGDIEVGSDSFLGDLLLAAVHGKRLETRMN